MRIDSQMQEIYYVVKVSPSGSFRQAIPMINKKTSDPFLQKAWLPEELIYLVDSMYKPEAK